MFKGIGGGGLPFGSDEPRFTSAGNQHLVLSETFEPYATTAALLTNAGGNYLAYGDQSLLSLPLDGNDPNADPSTSSGKCVRFNWPALPGFGTQADCGLELGVTGFPSTPSGKKEIVQLWYRMQSDFDFANGKKFVVLFNNLSEFDGITCRWTLNADVSSITLSDGNFMQTDGSGVYGGGLWSPYPYSYTRNQWLGVGGHLANSLNNQRWHRYTWLRQGESSPNALDGQLHTWCDGVHVFARGGPGQPLGTGGWTQGIMFQGTNNGGNTSPQWDEYDNVTMWWEP